MREEDAVAAGEAGPQHLLAEVRGGVDQDDPLVPAGVGPAQRGAGSQAVVAGIIGGTGLTVAADGGDAGGSSRAQNDAADVGDHDRGAECCRRQADAASAGSSLLQMAVPTATPRAPAASTSPTVSGLMPPMAR